MTSLILSFLLWPHAPARAYRPNGGDAFEVHAIDSAPAAGSVQTLEVLDSAHMRWAGRRGRERVSRPGSFAAVPSSSSRRAVEGTKGYDRADDGSRGGGHNQTGLHASTTSLEPERELPPRAGSSQRQPMEERQQLEETSPNLTRHRQHKASSGKRVRQLDYRAFAEDLKQRDLRALQLHLQNLSTMLKEDPTSMGILSNSSFGEGSSRRLPFLSAMAHDGWLPGLTELLHWNGNRSDKGSRLDINGTDDSGFFPLGLALEAGHTGVVRYLVNRGASTAASSPGSPTLLESAVGRGDKDLVDALVARGSILANGLAQLRKQLAVEATKLPRLDKRWPIGEEKGDAMDTMRALVPPSLRPSAAEREVIGGQPATWILLYQTRVMCAVARMRPGDSIAAAEVAEVLAAHGYDSFARDFSVSVVLVASVIGAFGLFGYMGFRLKLYGPLDAPVSLAEFIPGAFNPARVLDPDFDPSRQKANMPYRTVIQYLPSQGLPCALSLALFVKAFVGVSSSWLLQFVRIPPEKDPYDEDYQSDDDEESRFVVREQCRAHALCVRNTEVAVRTTVLLLVLFWLSLGAGRWNDATFCVLLCLTHSWIAACAASSAEPAPVPEKVPDESEGNIDAAGVVNAVFSVQYGPRWTRAIVSTRSTATAVTLRRTSLVARRRCRKPRQRAQGSESDASGGDPASNQTWGEAEVASLQEASARGSPYSDRFQRAFLQSGVLHIKHRSFLERSLLSMVIIVALLLWLFHLRWLASGSLFRAYADRTPAQLFAAYGAPGTAIRSLSLVLELALLWISAERLYGACSLLHVASLSLQQRCAALAFAGEHLSPPCPQSPKSGSEETAAVHAIRHMDESKGCTEFALELSTVRWNLLAEPVRVVYFCTLKLLAMSLLFFGMLFLRDFSPILVHWRAFLDPAVPLTIALCLSGPLLEVPVAAAGANREVDKQRQRFDAAVEEVLATAGNSDTDYVALRVKARDSQGTSTICWPGGRQLGFLEPCLIIFAIALIIGTYASLRAGQATATVASSL